MFSAVTTSIRADIRRQWRGLLLIVFVVTMSLAFAIVAGVAARRTNSAWSRFLHGTKTEGVFAEVPITDLYATLADLRARPGVTSAAAFTYIALSYEGLPPEAGPTIGGFAGISPGFLDNIYRPVIVEGRAADPGRPDEVTINQTAAEVTGLRPGDHIVLTSEPALVHEDATVVGIHRGALDVGLNNNSPQFLLTPAFGARWVAEYVDMLPREIGGASSGVVVARVSDPATRAALLDGGFITTDVFGVEITSGLDAQSTGFAVLAAVAALGTLAATSQTIARRVRRRGSHLPTLAALGLAPGARRAALAAPTVGAAVLGDMVAPCVAYAASPIAVTGLERRVATGSNHFVDFTLVGVLLAVAIGTFVAVGSIVATREDHARDPGTPRIHASPVALPGPAGLFGGRVAAGWSQRSGRIVARTHVIGLSLAVALSTGALLWTTSARHLTSTPSRYGQEWDVVITEADGVGGDGATSLEQFTNTLRARADVGRVSGRLTAGMVDVGSQEVEVLKIDEDVGAFWPTLIAGRRPGARDEITVGEAALRVNSLRLGDHVQIGDRTFAIVGAHVVPTFSNGEFGSTVAVPAREAGLEMSVPARYVLVQLSPGATAGDVESLAGPDLEVLSSPTRLGPPGTVANLGRIGAIDEVLLLVCALLAIAEFTNGLLLATRARRRDYATLRALGANRQTVGGTVCWHGALVIGTALVIAVPVGLILGRNVWQRTATAVHVGPDMWAVGWVIAVIAAVAAGLAALVSLTVAWSAARVSAAAVTSE